MKYWKEKLGILGIFVNDNIWIKLGDSDYLAIIQKHG